MPRVQKSINLNRFIFFDFSMMRNSTALISFFIVLISFSNSIHAQSQFVGKYGNPQFTVELQQAQQQKLVGNVSGAEGTFQLVANVVSQNSISGSYNYYGQNIPFTGYIQQNQLVINSEGQQFVLDKQGQGSTQNSSLSNNYQQKEPAWGMAFNLPAGWTAQMADGVKYIVSPDQKKLLVLLPDTESTSLADLKEGAKAGIVEGTTRLMPQGSTANFGNDGVSVPLAGTFNGRQAKGFAIGRLSPYKSGAVVIGVAETADYNASFENEIKTFAKNIQFFAPQRATDDNGNVADWSVYMKGRKLSYYKTETGFTMKINIYLCSDGSFKYTDNSSSFGGGASVVGTAGYTGRWQAYGKGNSGTLVLNYNDGSKSTYNTVLKSDGLYLDGKKYFRVENDFCN